MGPASLDGFENGQKRTLQGVLRFQLPERVEGCTILVSPWLQTQEIRNRQKPGMPEGVGSFRSDAAKLLKRGMESDCRYV